ncbi:MAG TPA: hypothetical protein VLS48_07840, partial [Anaerolineales bacterium]|nr:hypothetical protein [Anaerolineales bacterium]
YNGAFLLILQLVGINLGGTIMFRISGMNSSGYRYKRGKSAIFYVSLAATIAALAGLLFFQFSSQPMLQRTTRAAVALEDIQQAVEDHGMVNLVEATARFTRPKAGANRPESLLGVVYVEPKPEFNLPESFIAESVTIAIQDYIMDRDYNVIPLISVTVVEPPPSSR